MQDEGKTSISLTVAGFSQSEEISADLCCFCGGGISHNEDALFSKVYCCPINYPTPIEIWIRKLVVRALYCWPIGNISAGITPLSGLPQVGRF